MKISSSHNREAALVLIVAKAGPAHRLRAPVFLTPSNLVRRADRLLDPGDLVMGQMVVLLTKGIDLSVASNLALTGMFPAVAGKAFPRTCQCG